MTAILAECVWFPLKEVDAESLMDELTVEYYPLGEAPVSVEAFRTDRKDYIGVPRQFGLEYAEEHGIEVEDRTTLGRQVVLPKTVKLRDYQGPFISELLNQTEHDYDFIAKAATGKGKTTMALAVVQVLQSVAIVVVDQENLAEQWRDRAHEQFGVPLDKIGLVQGSVCDYKGKTVVIAMIQTLVQKALPKAFYSYFGIAIFDEVHITGAPTFQQALMMFPARYRFGVSATPTRRDALNKIIGWNIGEVDAHLGHKHKRSRVYYVQTDHAFSWYANKAKKVGRYLQEIAENADRNGLLAEVVWRLYQHGHSVLVISDRIEQLEMVKALCALGGLPEADMAVYAGYSLVWGFEKDPTPPRRPEGWERDTEYSPVRFVLMKKRIPKKRLTAIKDTTPVLFATYGMFAKGTDVPTVSAGVDCTPRSAAEQVHGRILREAGDKLTPVWVTVRDSKSFRAEHQFGQRVDEYLKSNAEIYEWHLDKGVRRVDVTALKREVKNNVALLKTCRYTTNIEGHDIVLIPSTRNG